jgi:putative ABC transport system permease protein
MSSVLIALRRLRDDRAAAVAVALVVLVTATIFAAAPRLLDRIGDDALQDTIGGAASFDRTLAVIEEQPIPPGDANDPLGEVDREGDRLGARFPSSIQAIVDERTTVVDSMRFALKAKTPDPTFVRFRIQPGAETRIHWVAGRPPSPTTGTTDLPPAPPRPGETPQTTAVVVEVGIAADAVRPIGHGLGETIILQPDERDVLVGPGGGNGFAAMKIVGLFTVDDPNDPFWAADHGLEHVTYRSLGGDSLFVDVTALVPPGLYPAYADLMPSRFFNLRTTWRWFVDPTTLHAANLDGIVRDLRRLDTTFPRTGPATQPLQDPALQSGLLPLLDGHRARWTSALAILLVLAIGPATIAIATLLLVASIAARRRRTAIVLVRGRGGTLGQLTRALLLEAAILVIPVTAVAIALAAILVPAVDATEPGAASDLVAGPAIRPVIAGAAIVAGIMAFLLAVTGLAGAGRVGPGARALEDAVPGRPSARRIVLDALVIVLAAAGAYLLRERGVSGASSTTALATADPLIAAVPALAGIAVALAAVRLVPLPIRLLGRVMAAGRGLVGMLALRRAIGSGTMGPLLVVLLVVASIGAFASTTLVHLERAAAASTWQTVGAPFRVLSIAGDLPRALDPAKLPGVRSAAGDFQALVAFGASRIRVQINAVDAPAYAALLDGSPTDPALPAEMLGPAPDALPVIVSSNLLTRPDGVKLGDQFSIAINAIDIPIRVVGARDALPGIPPTSLFAVISRTQLRERHPGFTLAPSILLLDAPADAGPALTTAVTEITPAVRIDDRAALERTFTDSPVTAAISSGVVLALAVAAAYAAVAVTAALAIAGASRAGETAKLRTLGLSRRQAWLLTIVEHGPTVLLAFAAGIGLGIGLFVLLEPGLGLDALVGAKVSVPLGADPRQIGLILGVVVAIASVGIGLAAWAQRRGSAVVALRRGFD